MTTLDMSQYLDVFLDEAREQLTLLETNVLQLERGDHSDETLQVIFRAAHTLKGSSRAMGFLTVGDLTHEMENVLDDLRQDKLALNTAIVNALLRCLDALTALVEGIAENGVEAQTPNDQTAALVAELSRLRTAPAEAFTPPLPLPQAGEGEGVSRQSFPLRGHEAASIRDAQAAGLGLFEVGVTLSAECLMKSVRVYMVLSALEPLGSVLASEPDEDRLEAEEFDRTFRVLLATEQPQETVEKALATVSEVERVTVSPWVEQTAQDEKASALSASPLPFLGEEEGPGMGAVTPGVATVTPGAGAETASAAAPKPAQAHAQTIRVDVSRLDSLLNLIGELVIDRTQIARIGSDLQQRYPRDERVTHLVEATHRVARITAELQDEIMKTRMLPIDGVFQRMPRMVRDLAQKTGKDVDFRMSGGETELDRSVLEALGDPLIHLLRNSVDHGIETPEGRQAAGKPAQGVVTLAARHEENHIVIEITDDGGGIDPVKIKAAAVQKGVLTQAAAETMTDRDAQLLIFAAGFSTAKTLSDISGRGVGMDIVKSNLEKLGGRVLLDSKPGRGSRFTIHLPLTLAIVRALLVSSGGGTYVLPLGNVVEMLRLGTDVGETVRRTVGGQAAIVLRGRTIPLASLAHVLCGDPAATRTEHVPEDAYVVVVGAAEKQVGLCVDGLIGEQEVVIKSLGALLGDIRGLSGATILGDGRVGLIVDSAKAIESIGGLGEMSGANL